jgi:plasmid stabilization system protein ParE
MGRKEKATSKAYQVRVSTNALQNIDEITGYIAIINHQPMNAIKVGDAIFATIDRIERNPLAFKERAEIPTKSKMYRTAACNSWSDLMKMDYLTN